MMEDANEIQEALSRSYGTPELDEDDLEAGELQEKQYICSFRIWKKCLPGTFPACSCVGSLRVSLWYSLWEKSLRDAMSDFHTPPPLGQTNSEGWFRHRPLLIWCLVSKHCHFPPFSFWFFSVYFPTWSPLPQNNKADQETVVGKYFVCLYCVPVTVSCGELSIEENKHDPCVHEASSLAGVRNCLFQNN